MSHPSEPAAHRSKTAVAAQLAPKTARRPWPSDAPSNTTGTECMSGHRRARGAACVLPLSPALARGLCVCHPQPLLSQLPGLDAVWAPVPRWAACRAASANRHTPLPCDCTRTMTRGWIAGDGMRATTRGWRQPAWATGAWPASPAGHNAILKPETAPDVRADSLRNETGDKPRPCHGRPVARRDLAEGRPVKPCQRRPVAWLARPCQRPAVRGKALPKAAGRLATHCQKGPDMTGCICPTG